MKSIYIQPAVGLIDAEPNKLMTDSEINQRDFDAEGGTGLAKKNHWSLDDDDSTTPSPVGESAGTGSSALSLPSGGKLWND